MLLLWIILGVVGGYTGLSVLFLLMPTLIHKKKMQKFHCKHISHRGGGGERLENTMPAFENAVEQGTEMFETDVQLTKDGQLVLLHDPCLLRISGDTQMVSDYNYADLPLIKETLDVTFDKEKRVTRENDDKHITLLQSVFEAFPDIPVNIDTKESSEELLDKTIALIREYKREDLVVMAHISSEVINKVHKKAPELLLGFSITRTIFLVLSFYFGFLPFMPLKESFLEIPLPEVLLKNDYPFAQWKIKLAVNVLNCLLISPVLFRHLQRRGIQVYLFVVNEDEEFERCFSKLGADGVMTDYPEKLTQYLKKTDSTESHTLLPQACALLNV